MNSGLQIFNNKGQLSVMSETRGTSCIGKATFVRTVQPSNATGVWVNGFSTYTFNSSEPCMFSVDCPSGTIVGVIDVAFNGNTYTIGVYAGTSTNTAGLHNQIAVDVWAVSMLGSRAPTYGLAMWSSAGVLTHDFTIPNMTFPTSSGDISIDGSMVGLSRPVVFGNSPYYDVTYFDNENGTYNKYDYRQFLARKAGNQIGYVSCLVFFGTYSGNPPADSTVSFASPFVVMEGNLLP